MNNKASIILAATKIINELLESSSSSSDDDEVFLAIDDKKPAKKVREQNFVEDVVRQYSEDDFKKNLHVSRETAAWLATKYSESNFYKKRSYAGGKRQLSAEVEMLSFLWFTANKITFRDVSKLFHISISTQYVAFNNVLEFISKDLATRAILFPRTDLEKEAIVAEFQKISGFPNVLGCIDCTYVSARKPHNETHQTNVNRRERVSITIQGICDAQLRFLDVYLYTGVPDRLHDARVLELSDIGNELPGACGYRYHILGDSAYPLREHLLTPYRDHGNLCPSEHFYNRKCLETHKKIKNAFGLLKSRFLQLARLDFHSFKTTASFVKACCVLHNICVERHDDYEFTAVEEDNESANGDCMYNSNDTHFSEAGEAKRNSIKAFLCT